MSFPSRTLAPIFFQTLLIILSMLSVGCVGPGLAGAPCPVALASTESISSEAGTLRVRMQLTIGDETIHLEIVTESRPDELVVVGLAGFGVRLFAVHQRGTEMIVEGASTFELRQVAVWVMDALHRSYWIEPPPGARTADWNWASEEVHETTIEGRTRREFDLPALRRQSTRSGDMTPRVTIDYAGLQTGPRPSGTMGMVSIRNPWCGYEARIAPVQTATDASY